MRVGIVGKGLSGLAAARELAALLPSASICILEKSAGGSGRIHTRRVDAADSKWAVDLGAQYFTAREPVFQKQVELWLEQGAVQCWDPKLVVVEASSGEIIEKATRSSDKRFVGAPSMTAICHALEKSLTGSVRVLQGHQVDSIAFDQENKTFQVSFKQADHRGLLEFDKLLITTPPAQALSMLSSSLIETDPLKDILSSVEMDPCWALGIKCRVPLCNFDAAFVHGLSCIEWIAKNSSKPGRYVKDPLEEHWVIHCRADWTRENFDEDHDKVTLSILEELSRILKTRVQTKMCDKTLFRWKYAKAQNPLAALYLKHASLPLFICGDWTNGSRIEGAYMSGIHAARNMLS